MQKLLARFLADTSGATAIEYGIIAAGIAAAIVGAISAFAGGVGAKFTSVNTAIN
jgi:pilus assembly protein Flp/PilA